jgi:N-acetylmuramoyl-L-alanine amidase
MHSRVAGARGRTFAPTGREPDPAARGRSAARHGASAFARWSGLALVSLLLLGSAQAQITASRIWPAKDYTRLTLESKSAVAHQVFSVDNPDRVVLDLETDMTPALAELDGKVVGDDPYIKGLRAA